MAQHGGARQTASTATAELLPPLSAPAFSIAMRERITLAQPRPDGLRSGNYYTETPLRPPKPTLKNNSKVGDGGYSGGDGTAGVHSAAGSGRSRSALNLSPPRVHRTRCVSSKLNKEEKKVIENSNGRLNLNLNLSSNLNSTESDDSSHRESILCGECGRCKCDACRQPRTLPSRWICDAKYECSAETLLDTCTCMCCVKGIFYHCTKDYDMDDDVSCADRPCSCDADRRCLRWSCIGALALILPCLLCYWPLKGCVKACDTCYARYHSRGCHCLQQERVKMKTDVTANNKRLLEDQIDC